MTSVDTETVKAAVRETYGRIASEQQTSGCCGPPGCCGPGEQPNSGPSVIRRTNGRAPPTDPDLGLGCGNPQAIAEL